MMARGVRRVPYPAIFLAAAVLSFLPLPLTGSQQNLSQNETIGRVPHAIGVGDLNGDGVPADVFGPNSYAASWLTVFASNVGQREYGDRPALKGRPRHRGV
jgi:hypothetical protein